MSLAGKLISEEELSGLNIRPASGDLPDGISAAIARQSGGQTQRAGLLTMDALQSIGTGR